MSVVDNLKEAQRRLTVAADCASRRDYDSALREIAEAQEFIDRAAWGIEGKEVGGE